MVYHDKYWNDTMHNGVSTTPPPPTPSSPFLQPNMQNLWHLLPSPKHKKSKERAAGQLRFRHQESQGQATSHYKSQEPNKLRLQLPIMSNLPRSWSCHGPLIIDDPSIQRPRHGPGVTFRGRRRSPRAPAATCTAHHLQDLQPAKTVQAGNIMSVKVR